MPPTVDGSGVPLPSSVRRRRVGAKVLCTSNVYQHQHRTPWVVWCYVAPVVPETHIRSVKRQSCGPWRGTTGHYCTTRGSSVAVVPFAHSGQTDEIEACVKILHAGGVIFITAYNPTTILAQHTRKATCGLLENERCGTKNLRQARRKTRTARQTQRVLRGGKAAHSS